MGNSVFAKAEGTMKCTDGACDFFTTCARRMERHKEETHKEHYKPTLKCPSCQNWYASNWYLELHIETDHRGERQYQCDREDCNYITTTKSKLSEHTKNCLRGKAIGNTTRKKVSFR